MLKTKAKVFAGIDVWIERVEATGVAVFRKAVWELFCDILEQTPQYSGRAVANWRIGINSPDGTYENDVGDPPDEIYTGEKSKPEPKRAKGDRYWIDYAKSVNWPMVRKIQRSSRVYITNSVRGDTDGGRSSELYMEDLQDRDYWAVKLRAANKPYETATETIIKFSWKDFSQVGGSLVEYL